MQGKEAPQSGGPTMRRRAAVAPVVADQRHGAGGIGRYRRRPEGELAPGEEIAGKGKAESEIEKDETGEPRSVPAAACSSP